MWGTTGEYLSFSPSADGLKQSTSAWTSLPLAFKHARFCQDLLHDQKEDEPGRCRMRVQLNIACRDSGRLDVKPPPPPPTPPLATTTTVILSMSRIFSKWIAEDLWRTHSGPNECSIFDFLSIFFLLFPCLAWGFQWKPYGNGGEKGEIALQIHEQNTNGCVVDLIEEVWRRVTWQMNVRMT